MSVEELYQKREEFSSRVQEVVGTELGNMGLEVKNFTITDISDENGYIKALGDGMIAQRKKDAEIQGVLFAVFFSILRYRRCFIKYKSIFTPIACNPSAAVRECKNIS